MKLIWYSTDSNSSGRSFNTLPFSILLSIFYVLNIMLESVGNTKMKRILSSKELQRTEIFVLNKSIMYI